MSSLWILDLSVQKNFQSDNLCSIKARFIMLPFEELPWFSNVFFVTLTVVGAVVK